LIRLGIAELADSIKMVYLESDHSNAVSLVSNEVLSGSIHLKTNCSYFTNVYLSIFTINYTACWLACM